MTDAVLALNAGSSSIKFGLFALEGRREPTPLARGLLEDRGAEPRLSVKDAQGASLAERRWPAGTKPADLLGAVLGWIDQHLGGDKLVAVGHRIVHGGQDFHAPIRLDAEVLSALAALTPLAPLHQPRSLEPVRALEEARPDLPQFGCFDTAFHRTIAPLVTRYALPRRFEHDGVRQYGFHGLSYAYIASRLAGIDAALPAKRTVVAHLGQGASLCAMQDGQSRDTTMGFSALDGLVMGTRCGSIDPGVVLHLQRSYHLDVDEVEHLLYQDSGLLGVSGVSADMRDLVASQEPRAQEAIDLFTFRAARETAALANTLGGLDAVVFTGGIGEHSNECRAGICERLAWMGVAVDPEANARSAPRIDTRRKGVELHIIPTDEEAVIARTVAEQL